MSNTIKSDIVNLPKTENAGSRSSARFAYQRNWALAELIEYHLQGKEYVFAFEFHDDILILDSEETPSHLQFIQVKTNTTGDKWSVNDLIKTEKGKNGNPNKLSIIGKLYENKEKFSKYNSKLRFVTNAYFSFTGSLPVTSADRLDASVQERISSAVKVQLGTSKVDLNALQLERSSLSVEDQEKHIRGILGGFFEALFGSDHRIAVAAWYQSISDQINLRNNYPSDHINSFDEFIRNKCITKSEIDNFVNRVNRSRNSADSWDIVKTQLEKEGASVQELIQFHRSWNKYSTDRLDYDNEVLKLIEREISSSLSTISLGNSPTLNDVISKVRFDLSNKLKKVASIFDVSYVNSIILWLYCDQL